MIDTPTAAQVSDAAGSSASASNQASTRDGQEQRGDTTQHNTGNHTPNTSSSAEPNKNWVELEPNAAPQVAFAAEPEVIDGAEPSVDFEANVRPALAESPPPTEQPQRTFWEKVLWKVDNVKSRLNPKVWGGLLVILVVVIVVPAVVIGTKNSHSPSSPPSETSSTTPDGGDATATEQPSGSTTTGSSSSLPSSSGSQCNESDMKHGVTWIGIARDVGWDFEMASAKNPKDCCRQCFEEIDECNGWLYLPGNDTNSDYPPCNLVYGFKGPEKGGSCPNGKPDIVFSAGEDDDDGSAGGGGPCARNVRGG